MAGAITPSMHSIAARVAAFAAALSLIGSPADAQTWREYRYAGFAVQFPAEPTVESGTYATAMGKTVGARIYTAQ